MRFLLLAFLAMLAACASLTPQDQANLTAAGTSLASVAAAHNTTVQTILNDGALICHNPAASVAEMGVVAVANSAGAPVSVINQGQAAVAQVCAALDKVPGPMPAGVADVPVVTVAATGLPAVASVPVQPMPVSAAK